MYFFSIIIDIERVIMYLYKRFLLFSIIVKIISMKYFFLLEKNWSDLSTHFLYYLLLLKWSHLINLNILCFPAMQCDYGAIYLPCGDPCPQGCPGHNQTSNEFCESMTCLEGCYCPEGYVRSSEFESIWNNLNLL